MVDKSKLLHTPDRSRSTINHLDPDPPFVDVVQELYKTGPMLEACTIDHADCTALTRQHELDHTDHTDHTDQESICSEICRS